MELKKGYKQTDIGVVPEEWEVHQLSKIGNFNKGKGIRKDQVVASGLPAIRYGEIYTTHHNIIKNFYSFISDEVANESKKLKKGELLFAGSGETAEEIGKCVAFVDDCEAYAGGDIIILSPTENVSSVFFGYLLNFHIIVKQKMQAAQGDAVVHIYANNLKQILIPLPPKPEQTAIATALSDTDELIASLEKLIAKKRLIKQGAMQELLTGKRRLAGFDEKGGVKKGYKQTELGLIPGDWEVTPIGNLFHFKQGVQCPVEKQYTVEAKGRLRFIRIIDITNPAEPNRYIDDPGISHHIIKDDLFMVRYGSPGLLGYGFEGVIANNLFRLLTKKNISNNFYFHYLTLIQDKILLISGSSTMPAINFSTINSLVVIFPPNKEEQTAIAQILSDMDAEIEALENKLAKYRVIKQGMMQSLLTGRIRLV